jgi:DNA replicative helicase MCM subunit Mcm2 (Cdc46/Mcm family)
MNKKDIINYSRCGSCFDLIKSNRFYCKNCQSKIRNNTESNSSIHKMKFIKSSKALTKAVNVTHRYIGSYHLNIQ